MRCHRADHWLASGADRALGAKYLVLLAPGLMRGGIVLSRSSVKTGDQTFYAKRFSQEAQRPGAERALSSPLNGIGSHEDYRRAVAVRYQSALQVHPTHARHPHIGNQTFGVRQAAGLQELLGGCEGRCRVAEGSDERIG